MSEFFKAATRCDPVAAEKAPMYVDRSAIAEEEHRAQRLVEQTMRTELLLREMQVEHDKAQRLQQNEAVPLDTSAVVYKAPPQCTGHLPPEQRNVGSRAIQKSMNERANLWRQNLSENLTQMRHIEGREVANEEKQSTYRQQQAEREFNALIVSRQIAARENELESIRAIEQNERGKRRAHPIDVLHRRIAEELAKDIHDATGALEGQLETDSAPIERTYEDEQLRAIREFRRDPIWHIPSASNVAR